MRSAGRCTFPDFGVGTELLLPGLWPEGNATIPGSTALWIPPNALAELRGGGSASVPLATSAASLREPAATLLRRAKSTSRRGRPSGPPGSVDRPARGAVRGLRVDGEDVAVAALGSRDWFASYVVLDGGGPPLVLAALPHPTSSSPADLLARSYAMRSLLGYRIAEIVRPKAPK